MERNNAQPEKGLAVDSRTSSRTRKINKGTGKKGKRFLEQNDVLSLAASIGDTQEQKSAAKVQRPVDLNQEQPSTTKPKKVSARAKIKEKKSVLLAQRAEAKRNKAKSRKKEKVSGDGDKKPSKEAPPAKRKGVSFA